MSLRSLRIPGARLGMGTFVNNNIDGKRKLVYFGTIVFAAADNDIVFTQGQTRMATLQAVFLSYSILSAAQGSASFSWGNSTLTNGTVTLRNKPKTADANTANTAGQLHYWMVGTPDPQRIVV